MSAVPVAFESLRATAIALVITIIHFFLNLGPALRKTLSRKSPVTLTLNEHHPSVLDPKTGMTLFQMIGDKCPSLYGDNAYFKPVWWLPGGNLQTIWCVLAELFFHDEIPYQRQFLRTADGGTLSLDIYPPFESRDDPTPILFILHGLTGSSQENYIRATVKDVCRPNDEGGAGIRVVAMNFRGCDVDTPVTTPRLYHAGETDDTRTALLWLSNTYPKAPLFGCAFSMGASTMASYLGQEGKNTPLKGAICVSNPFNWVTATEFIEKEGGFICEYGYGPVLGHALLTMFKNGRYAFETDKRIGMKEIFSKRYTTIRWFDDRVTAPLFGFRDAWDYYEQASSWQWIEGIKVPLLTIHSEDDPMVSAYNLPKKEIKGSSHVVMASTYAGGHVAWFTDREKRWFTTPTKEWILALLDVDPTPKEPTPALPVDAKGVIRARQWDDRIGYKCLDDVKGLKTARVYNRKAHAPVGGS